MVTFAISEALSKFWDCLRADCGAQFHIALHGVMGMELIARPIMGERSSQ